MADTDRLAAVLDLTQTGVPGGPNWTPAVAARAWNDALVRVAVALELSDEATARAGVKQRIDAYDARTLAAVDRANERLVVGEHQSSKQAHAQALGAESDSDRVADSYRETAARLHGEARILDQMAEVAREAARRYEGLALRAQPDAQDKRIATIRRACQASIPGPVM